MVNSEDEDAEAERLEDLLARCLELGPELGPMAIEKVCAEAPESAEGLRGHLRRLAAIGMLPDELLPESMRAGSLPSFEGYQLEALLGSGGMGVVYRAIHQPTGQRVALKTADPRVPWSDRARERFRREVSAIGRVDHPHVVGVLQVGEEAGLPFYTMPFVKGVTLAELLDGLRARTQPGEPPSMAALVAAFDERIDDGQRADEHAFSRGLIATLCRIAFEVAGGLHHLHEQGIVHRDVKPSNILVDTEGRAHLFDLGLAHLVDDRRLTLTGDFAGSPQYAAPEQISANRGGVNARTDVYGLGATLYEALSLRPPLVGRDTPDLLRRIVREEPPALRHVAPGVPRDLEILCALCLEKSPAHRYSSAAELAADLGRFLALERIQARAPGRFRRVLRSARRNPAKATALGLAGTMLLGTPIALAFHTRQLGRQRDAANQSALTARREANANREVSSFLQSLVLGLEQSQRPGDRAAARELLHVARLRLSEDEQMAPATRAGLIETVASILTGMGRELEALPLLDIAFNIRQVELGTGHPEARATLFALADLHAMLGDLSSARGLADRGVREADGELRPTELTSLGNLALAEGRVDRALEYLRDALSSIGDSENSSSIDRIATLRSLATAQLAAGELEASFETVREAIDIGERNWDPDPAERARSFELLASIQDARGEPVAAMEARERAVDLLRARGLSLTPAAERVLERMAQDSSTLPSGGLRPEDWLALAEMREGESARAAFLAALESLEALGATAEKSLIGRARVGLARSALLTGDQVAARLELDQAASLLERARGDLRFGDEWFELELDWFEDERAAGQIDRLPADHLDRARTWFAQRIERSVEIDLDLVSGLRQRAARLIELGAPEEALFLLDGARGMEQRFGARARVTFDHGLAQFAGSAYGEAMQRGITSLQAERFEEALEAFRTCAELKPADPVSHINQACALTRSGRLSEALAALERAADRGYAHHPDAIELTANDPDLRGLHSDPRFSLFLESLRDELAVAERSWKKLRFREPAGLGPQEPAPLLVVLHAFGSTPDEVLRGPWVEIAETLGARLLAPSGRFPTLRAPKLGMSFVDSPERLVARPRTTETSVRHAISALREVRPVDPERTILVGQELGGTLAFRLMVTSAGLAQGALLIDAPLPLELVDNIAPGLVEQGLAVAVLADPSRPLLRLPGQTALGADWESTRRMLAGLGLRARVDLAPTEAPDASQLLEILRFLGAR